MWTLFSDMHSGGNCKLPYEYIFVELPEKEAEAWFECRFGRNPNWVTCYCCGNDYSIYESENLEDISGFYRNCKWDGNKYIEKQHHEYKPYIPLTDFIIDNIGKECFFLEKEMIY